MTSTGSVFLTPKQARESFRRGVGSTNTSGMCAGYYQCNLVVLSRADSFDFLEFCLQNPRPCPVIEIIDGGSRNPLSVAPGADIATDLGRYRVWDRAGGYIEVPDVSTFWSSDLVSFLLGCSYSFEHALLAAGVPMRHHEQGVMGAPMYMSTIQCQSVGAFGGPQVVTMRPIPVGLVDTVTEICESLPLAHGAPLHIGDPRQIGIAQLEVPDLGSAVELKRGDVPVFWACGVTSQMVAQRAGLGKLITHAPGYMFISDLTIDPAIPATGTAHLRLTREVE